MSSRPSSFVLTNPAAHNGKAIVYTLGQLLAFPPPTWLIQDLVPSQALTGLCGAPGVGKSMVALDWALCVATGMPWLGEHAVERGFALYIAAEGHSGLSIRANAWLKHYNINPSQARFGLVKGRLAIKGGGPEDVDMEEYDTLFRRIDDEIQEAPKLVVIDTLARCLDGNENESLDMGGFLNGAERLVEEYGSTVVIVHHKNALGNRERGHTSFRGALGALHFVERVPKHPDLLMLVNDKQRDSKEHDRIGLQMQGTEMSAVLVPAELPTKSAPGLGAQRPMRKMDMLTLLGTQENGLTFSEWRLAAQIPRRTFARRVAQLLKDGELQKDDTGRYSLVPATYDIAELERNED